jgi:hypothetical protein
MMQMFRSGPQDVRLEMQYLRIGWVTVTDDTADEECVGFLTNLFIYLCKENLKLTSKQYCSWDARWFRDPRFFCAGKGSAWCLFSKPVRERAGIRQLGTGHASRDEWMMLCDLSARLDAWWVDLLVHVKARQEEPCWTGNRPKFKATLTRAKNKKLSRLHKQNIGPAKYPFLTYEGELGQSSCNSCKIRLPGKI